MSTALLWHKYLNIAQFKAVTQQWDYTDMSTSCVSLIIRKIVSCLFHKNSFEKVEQAKIVGHNKPYKYTEVEP